MTVIACGQNEILGDECVFCGGWLDRVTRGGLVGPHGWRFCELECINGQVEYEAQLDAKRHLEVRDLRCACEICAENGLPTQAMRDEHAAYRSAIEETP
jgi:hypothetical protein